MKQMDRSGKVVESTGNQDRMLGLLYGNAFGRAVLRVLISPVVSKAAGCFLSSRLSVGLIHPFVRKNGIDLTQFEPARFRSYNEFFSRKIRAGLRPIDREPSHLIAPCDSKLTVLPITPESRFLLKNTLYTLPDLLKNKALAASYAGGYAMIFRLTVDDYHRYCYVDDGEKEGNVRIPGVLHTVNPIANDVYPIYKENAREYSVLHSRHFGKVLMMEVGALLVGKIVNHHGAVRVCRGQEKGYFEFGGSTVVLLLEKDKAVIDGDLLENSRRNIETVVRMGEKIGRAV
ncbi:MAG: phosphatidylserine decarboxylase [Clostridia bacterium]|nr:phosphatidylserine decarboxylase [Clostridia bacterium]